MEGNTMKQDRLNLENALSVILTEYNLNEDIFNSVHQTLKDKNITKGQSRGIFNKVIALESLDLPLLYWFTKALYAETKEVMINPNKFFTEIEEEEFSKIKADTNIDIKIKDGSLILKNVSQLNDDHWTTNLTYKQISNLYNNGLIKYNPKSQRNLKSKIINGSVIEKININKKSIKEIKDLMLKGLFIPNTITLNILKSGEEEIGYNENEKIIDIKGEIDIIDGFHRSLAILEAIRENPKLEGSMIISLCNFDIGKASGLIVQEDKRNKINKEHIKYLNQENLENQVIKNLNENVKSELRGLITTDIVLVKNNKALMLFNTVADAVEMQFELNNQRDTRKVSDFLIEFFNELTGIMYDDFKDIANSRNNSVATYSSMFVGYIVIARDFYYNNYENWQNKLEIILEKIDFIKHNELWTDLKLTENRLLKKDYKKIIKYFESIL
jgi:hypothetical protein